MTVYAGGSPPRKPRRNRRRRWVRVALWTTGTMLLVVIAVAAAGFYMFYGDYSRLTTPPKDFRQAENQIDPTLPVANAPAIALVIGSDHRYTDGSAPARSDTLMLVRIDPRTHLISLLSLPRDLWVTIPGFGQDKINAAYSDGGPKLALETVKQVTGLHVNYLIGVELPQLHEPRERARRRVHPGRPGLRPHRGRQQRCCRSASAGRRSTSCPATSS